VMDRRPTAPGFVRWVASTLEDAGYETWAVGGAVRNALLGLPSGDWDLATRAPPGVLRRLFPRTVPVGLAHGTVGVLTREGVLLEVTTFRRDVETFGRHAVVEFAETLLEDLSRRDFTVNAVAWHPIREEFQDPFGGRADLAAGLLRAVGLASRRFSEDYLRVLRGLRFSGRFRLRIEGDTWEALCRATAHLSVLSPERVREELLKVLAEDLRPSGALALYGASGVLDALYPELAAVRECRDCGMRGDHWVRSLLTMDLLPTSRPMLRLAALLQGMGYPGERGGPSEPARRVEDASPVEEGSPWDAGSAVQEGLPSEDAVPVEERNLRARDRTAALMIRLRFSNAEIREVTGLLEAGSEPLPAGVASPELRRWLHRAGPERFPSLARLWVAGARLDRLWQGSDPAPVVDVLRRLRGELRSHPPLRLEDLALNGRDLVAMGLKPGPRFGKILDALMEQVLLDPTLNRRESLVEAVGRWLEEEG
jgi:tRNA nucleotidyltransferase (CCA-adding enzyme)